MEIKDKLIEVFNNTLEHSIENKLYSTTKKHNTSEIVYPCYCNKEHKNIFVVNLGTVSALVRYNSGKMCVLNMASYKRPGGGVRSGAISQEEGLFRCSNLGISIDESNYPLLENECLYTKDAIFFKDFNYNYMNPIISDVITIAALNLNDREVDDEYYNNITSDKIRLMLSLSAKNGVNNLILGAWGCGVFKNDPYKISSMFKKIIIGDGYFKFFDNIIFSIINDKNSVDNNFEIFKTAFEK